ncbi:helix-turn-helix transcriptional regulator [Vagococcus fluvialis]|uniref:helix-turn-helix transcriptional regulator n=1 Tax=Vagococcus fluvialis TaxID=2738 RepID=UPI003B5AA833
MNVIAGYRKMLGYTQEDMAKILNISKQSYWLKENKKVSFSDIEKSKLKEMLVPLFPNITIDEIFFT